MRTFGKIVGTLAGGLAGLGLLLQAPASAAVPLVGGSRIVTGPASGSALVNLFTSTGLAATNVAAYPGSPFAPGVRVATGDLTGDGVPDVATAPGPGAAPHVKVFDGATGALVRSFFAYASTFTGGVFVAMGDVNGDGRADIVTGADAGGAPHVKVFDAVSGAAIRSFFAYGSTFTGGVRVAAADVNGDGKADIVTGAGPGGGPHVNVFDGATNALLSSFFAYDAGSTGGIYVAAGDVTGDGRPEVITGAGAGSPVVRAFSMPTAQMVRNFLAYASTYTGGVRVAAGNLTGDSRAEIVTGPAASSASVRTFDPSGALQSTFVAYQPAPAAGVFVAVAPVSLRRR